MKKSLLAALVAATLCIPAVASADDETDMAKITCKEFLSAGESEMGLMLTWIDGYMRACLETHLSIMKRFNSMLAMAI